MSKPPSLFVRATSIALAAALATVPTASASAGPAKPAAKKEAAPATDGKTIALMRFSGAASAAEQRAAVQGGLEQKGFKIKSVALEPKAAADKVKCKGAPDSDECLAAIGKWLNSNPKTAADFIVYGSATDGKPGKVTVGIYDIGKNQRVRTFTAQRGEADLILGVILPQAIATALEHHITPPPGITPEEQAVLDQLDEPEKTPEEIAAEKRAIEEAEKAAAQAKQDQVIDTSDIKVDLKADFKDFCRTGPKKKRKTREDPKDLRPKCQRGPFWGYWQPRAWVALGLVVGGIGATAAFYGLALAARGPYKSAVDDLEAFEAEVGCNPRENPQCIENSEGTRYTELATEVSRTGSIMRRRAIVGDVLLGTTALVTGVLAIIIFQDRSDAKNYIRQEKGLRAISTLRVAPWGSKSGGGMGLSFKF